MSDAPGAAPRAPEGHPVHTLAAGLAVVGLAGLLVGAATASGVVAAVAHVVAGLTISAAGLLVLTVVLLRPLPLPPTAVPPGAGDLAALDRDGLALLDREVLRTLDAVTACAHALGRVATSLLAAGGLVLVLAQPALWLAGDAGDLPAGTTGTIALALVLAAPVAGLVLCRAVLAAEWEPPRTRPAVPSPGGADAALRTVVARRTVALAVGEVVEARRRRVVLLMGWLLAAEVVLVLAVTLARIGRT